jgi:hypothetical protein
MGATNPNWVAPTAAQLATTPPGDALSNAVVAFLSYVETSGVPDEHTYNAQVAAIQSAYDSDPLAQVTGPIDVDGGYGPNTQALVQALSGSSPAINAAAVAAGGVPQTTTSSTTGSSLGMFVLVAAIAGGAYLVFGRKKRQNPRRRRRNGGSGSLGTALR